MKISTHLPNIQETCLLVSTGKQEAHFFLVENSEVNEIHHFKTPKPEYTDKESRTERRDSGGGSMFGGGSPFKHLEDELERSFIKKLSESIDKLCNEHKAEVIFLFCPTYLSKQIENSLARSLQNKIEYIFYGNYHNQHPFVLLSKIQEYQRMESEKNQINLIKPEALNILKNTDAAGAAH